jgi:hypothetical protein
MSRVFPLREVISFSTGMRIMTGKDRSYRRAVRRSVIFFPRTPVLYSLAPSPNQECWPLRFPSGSAIPYTAWILPAIRDVGVSECPGQDPIIQVYLFHSSSRTTPPKICKGTRKNQPKPHFTCFESSLGNEGVRLYAAPYQVSQTDITP